MNQFEVIMPKMGESIEEATITKWFIKPGDKIKEDDLLLEIATDKVDSEIPSPVAGTVKKLLYSQDEIVLVGSVIAIIDLDNDNQSDGKESVPEQSVTKELKPEATDFSPIKSTLEEPSDGTPRHYYSPLVRKIATEEKVTQNELDSITGSGLNGRVQKNDIFAYIQKRRSSETTTADPLQVESIKEKTPRRTIEQGSISTGDEVIPMDRIRKIIAGHMIRSQEVSAHVTNVVEADVTEIVNWRNRVKEEFEKKEGVRLTYLPVFLDAVIKALKDFPRINSSVDGENIIVKKSINLGIAVSLENYNLIVPVIKDAGNLNLSGLSKELSRLASAARNNLLKPEEIQNGTFTVTNFGTFRNIIGTPIINQPQVAILATGAIEKKPAVLETVHGDVIAIRHKMYLSLSYDHRIIDGALGGAFLRKVADYIESFDPSRPY